MHLTIILYFLFQSFLYTWLCCCFKGGLDLFLFVYVFCFVLFVCLFVFWGEGLHTCTLARMVIRHFLRRKLLLQWYLQQQRVRVRVMIGFLVWGRVRIKIRIRVRVRVGVTFNVGVYRWSTCRRSKCRTFAITSTTLPLHQGLTSSWVLQKQALGFPPPSLSPSPTLAGREVQCLAVKPDELAHRHTLARSVEIASKLQRTSVNRPQIRHSMRHSHYKEGSFRERIKGFGPLGASKAIQTGHPHSCHFFLLQGTKKAPRPKWNSHLYFSVTCEFIWGASRTFLKAYEAMALDITSLA